MVAAVAMSSRSLGAPRWSDVRQPSRAGLSDLLAAASPSSKHRARPQRSPSGRRRASARVDAARPRRPRRRRRGPARPARASSSPRSGTGAARRPSRGCASRSARARSRLAGVGREVAEVERASPSGPGRRRSPRRARSASADERPPALEVARARGEDAEVAQRHADAAPVAQLAAQRQRLLEPLAAEVVVPQRAAPGGRGGSARRPCPWGRAPRGSGPGSRAARSRAASRRPCARATSPSPAST